VEEANGKILGENGSQEYEHEHGNGKILAGLTGYKEKK